MISPRDLTQEIRRVIPLPVLVRIGRRRVETLWQNPDFRAYQEANMRFLLEHTERADEIPQLAREYAEFDLLRNYRRWHPGHLIRQRVEGAEWLTSKREPGRGVVLSFLHHGQYDGVWGSLDRAGIETHIVVAPEAFEASTQIQLRQHYRVCGITPGAHLTSTALGSAHLAGLLEQGKIVAIATDVAGRTPITFLGRDMLGSFGAARIAVQTGSAVVLVTSHPGPDGFPFVRVHPPLEPGDDPAALLAEIVRRHEPAVLGWPAAFDSPIGRLGSAAQAG